MPLQSQAGPQSYAQTSSNPSIGGTSTRGPNDGSAGTGRGGMSPAQKPGGGLPQRQWFSQNQQQINPGQLARRQRRFMQDPRFVDDTYAFTGQGSPGGRPRPQRSRPQRSRPQQRPVRQPPAPRQARPQPQSSGMASLPNQPQAPLNPQSAPAPTAIPQQPRGVRQPRQTRPQPAPAGQPTSSGMMSLPNRPQAALNPQSVPAPAALPQPPTPVPLPQAQQAPMGQQQIPQMPMYDPLAGVSPQFSGQLAQQNQQFPADNALAGLPPQFSGQLAQQNQEAMYNAPPPWYAQTAMNWLTPYQGGNIV